MVGPSGSGKSMAWRVLLKALERLEGVEGVCHVIDPKVIHFPLSRFLSFPSLHPSPSLPPSLPLSLSLSPSLPLLFTWSIAVDRPFPRRICMAPLTLTPGSGQTVSSLTSYAS